MPVFINGGTPSQAGDAYSGAIVSTVKQLLVTIRDALTSSQHTTPWIVVEDNIVASEELIIKGNDSNNNKIQARFHSFKNRTYSNQANSCVSVTIRPLDPTTGAETTAPYSPDWEYMGVQIEEGQNNKFFMVCDEDSFAMSTLPAVGNATGLFGGYLDRLDDTDVNGMYIGLTMCFGDSITRLNPGVDDDASLSYELAYHLPYDAVNRFWTEDTWFRIGQGFEGDGLVTTNSNFPVPFFTCSDFMGQNFFTNSPTFTSNVSFAQSFYGGINALNQKPILSNFYFLEGWNRGFVSTMLGNYRVDPATYARNRVLFRGNVKHLVTGLGSYLAGEQWQAGTGEVYVSTGDLGWQGMRIA